MQRKILKKDYYQGLKLIEDKVNLYYKEAISAYEKEKYNFAYLLGFIAFEELGKGRFLLDNWHKKCIHEGEWKSTKTFKDHNMKIQKARIETVTGLLSEIIKNNPSLNPGGEEIKIHHDTSHMENYTKLRDVCLYIDFDFTNNQWITPEALANMRRESRGIIDEVIGAYRTLQYRKEKMNL